MAQKVNEVKGDNTVDLTDWTYLFTYGYTLDIYAYGSLRLGIDKKTGEKIISYVV